MYTALIFDIDGTTVPNSPNGMPSKRVIEAVRTAKAEGITCCAATGRSWTEVLSILGALELTDPCVIGGGSQIVDPRTGDVLWDRPMGKEALQRFFGKAKDLPSDSICDDEKDWIPIAKRTSLGTERVLYLQALEPDFARAWAESFNDPEIAVNVVPSWTAGMVDLHVTHKDATKKGGVAELRRMLDIPKNCIVAVGDGGNDLALFESAGLTVAMGNAVDELKEAADVVAPSVDDDGLAWVVEEIMLAA